MHPEPELLALVALGEPAASPEELEHIADCAACSAELESLTSAVRAGRATASAPALVEPDERVWRQVSATLGLKAGVSPARPGADPRHPDAEEVRRDGSVVRAEPVVRAEAIVRAEPIVLTGGGALGSPAGAAAASPGSAGTAGSPADPVDISLRRPRSARRQWPVRWVAVAAAAILVVAAVGGVATTFIVRGITDGQTAAPTVVGQAILQALPDWPGASGDAKIEAVGDSRTMTVTVSDNTNRPDTFREVWLMNSSLTKLVSLGLLSSDTGSFEVPADIDMSEYTIVDVSSEPLDGNPAHSSNSIVRGQIGT